MAEMKQMSLRESGKFDYSASHKTTGWAIVCHDRWSKNISRKARIKLGLGKSGKRTWEQRQAERMK